MLVYVRPSNEALHRARVPGAQDQRGCSSNPFYRGGSASKKGTWLLPLIFLRPRVARAQEIIRLLPYLALPKICLPRYPAAAVPGAMTSFRMSSATTG